MRIKPCSAYEIREDKCAFGNPCDGLLGFNGLKDTHVCLTGGSPLYNKSEEEINYEMRKYRVRSYC